MTRADLTSAVWAMQAFETASFQRASRLLHELDTPLATCDHQLARAAAASGLLAYSFEN